MTDDLIKNNVPLEATEPKAVKGPVAPGSQGESDKSRISERQSVQPRRNFRRTPGREGRPKPEFDQRMLSVRRVARVAAGGRRFNFSAALVIGNRKGSVGVGIGKGADTTLAIEKALRNGKKNLLKISFTKNSSIPHIVEAKYSSARIMIQPAPGRGVVAGSALRTVIELAGIRDVTAKIISPSKNKLNIARAAIQALSAFATRNQQPTASSKGTPPLS